MNCAEFRTRKEAGLDDYRMREHATGCRRCSEYARLADATRPLLQQSIIDVPAPESWYVMVAIRRELTKRRAAAEQRRWLFTRLAPYVVAVLLLLVASARFGNSLTSADSGADVATFNSPPSQTYLLAGFDPALSNYTPDEVLADQR
jgi:hypothetical protein